jgi:16S rRNA (uracil1498-N3)-methyltransferase
MMLFHADHLTADSSVLVLRDQEAHHILIVLRMRPGQEIWVTNGCGLVAKCRMTHSSKKEATFSIEQTIIQQNAWESEIVLASGLLKNRDRMEWLVEKSTEIGVNRLCFLETERSERSKIRTDRMQLHALAAMKQSLQSWLPQVSQIKLDELVAEFSVSSNSTSTEFHSEDVSGVGQSPDNYGQIDSNATSDRPIILIAHESAEYHVNACKEQLKQARRILLLVGPEGGFSDNELAKVVKSGGIVVGLGQNRLRTETAALTLLQYVHFITTADHNKSGVGLYDLIGQ